MIIPLLHRVTEGLERFKIPYMLSGSVAMSVYTLPRMTMDIDIVIELSQSDVDAFLSIFEHNFYVDPISVTDEIKRNGMFNVIDHKSGFKVDFIIRKENEYRKLEFNRKMKKSIGNKKVWVVSLEDLVISKIEWIQQLQSPKQINDIENLLDSKIIDKNYILKWCKALKLNTFNLLK
jgi:hypothetical protein